MSTMNLKEALKAVYSSADEIRRDYDEETQKVGYTEAGVTSGEIIIPHGLSVVCLIPEPTTDLVLPDDYKDVRTYAYALTVLRDTDKLYIVQIPSYGGTLLGGSARVKTILTDDIQCYWSISSVASLLK